MLVFLFFLIEYSHFFSPPQHYRLVIVGHSLGAGVASILAVLLKDYFPDLVCYAYSPPGCVFRSVCIPSVSVYLPSLILQCSFPLVQYSKEFITSVVIGNDMVPRYCPYFGCKLKQYSRAAGCLSGVTITLPQVYRGASRSYKLHILCDRFSYVYMYYGPSKAVLS